MYNYYLLHGTKSENHILNIIKTGFILPAKDIKNVDRFMGGDESLVYFSIYFEDLKNIKVTIFNYMLILHPDVIKDYQCTFDKGWGYQKFIEFEKNDIKFSEKIDKIHTYLSNPDLPQILRQTSEYMHHQLYMPYKIPINKYLIGIIYYNVLPNNKLFEIKELIQKKKLNVKVYENMYPPNLNIYKI